MSVRSISAASGHHRLEWNGSVLEVTARRAGLRTEVVLFRDGHAVGKGTGMVRVLLPVPQDARQPADGPGQTQRTSPTVSVLSVSPGVISRAVLLVPRPKPITGPAQKVGHDGTDRLAAKPSAAGGEPGSGSSAARSYPRCRRVPASWPAWTAPSGACFDPPPGTLAARLLTFQRQHPALYASRRVAIAVGEVVLGLLSVALFIQLILRGVVNWITERLPRFDLPSFPWPDMPSIPWPDIDLPSIPWPDLPDFALPGWLLAVVGTAKYWVPIVMAIGLAVHEVKRKKRKRLGTSDPGGGN